MKSFDKYILKEIASPFGIGLLVYTFTLLINMIFILSDTLIAKEASTLTVLKILAYMMPDFLSFTIPMSTLMGILAGLSRMSTDSEIIAFKTIGVSNSRILKPIMIFAVVNWLFSSWLIMYMAPEASFRLTKIWSQVAVKQAISKAKPGNFYTDLPGYVIYFNDVDRKTDEWKDVFLYTWAQGDSDTVILAKKGKFIQDLEEKDSYIVLADALVHSYKKKEPDKSYELAHYTFKKERVSNPTQPMKQTRKERQLVFPELVKRLKKEPKNRMLSIEFQRKFALPFACLALGFLALSLGISTKKGGKVSGFIISLGIIFIYYTVSITAENMVKKDLLSPFLGMWSANIFLLVTGIILYYFTSKEKTINWERLFAFIDNIKNRLRQRTHREKPKRNVILVIKIRRIPIKFRVFKIIDRYVAKKIIFSFFLIFTSLVMVFYITDIVELIDDVVENNVPFYHVLEYAYYHTPEILSFVLPVSILTAVLLSFSVMSKNNELIAVQVSGISLYRLTVPAVVIGLLLSAAYFYIQENLTPEANKKKREVQNIIFKQHNKIELETNKRWVVGQNGEFYFYDFQDKKNNKIVNFNVIYMGKKFSPAKRISAKYAAWINQTEISLRNGFERNYRDNVPVGFNKFNRKELNIPGGQELFTRKIAFPEYMNIKTLKQYIRYLEEKKSETQKYEAQLYYKYAFPLSSLVMVLIAIPFSFLMGKRGTLFGIGAAILISMVFWFAFAVFSALGSTAILSPFISAFAPLFIFAVVSIYLFMNIKT